MGTMPKLYLIDASAYFYRAFFALPPLTTSGGLPINAIYGFTTMLQKLMADHQPKYLAAVLDRPEPTFRHAVYQDYKANRDEMPDNLSVQIPYIKDVIRGFNIVALEKPGYEADDIIGTVALRAAADGAEVVIVSGDKDLFQLVRPGITVLDTMKDRVFDSQGVLDKYGLGPDQIIDMLGLMGDTSDNVPGVPGIGPKTAVSLLAQFGSMDGIYEHIESITKKKVKQNLLEFRDQAYLSRRLVTLDTAVSLERSWKDCRVISPDTEALRELFKQFEFTRLLKGLTPQKKTKKDYRLVGDKAGVEALIGKLRDLPRFTLDLETTSADPMRAEIVGISFAWEDDRAWYVPVAHQDLEPQPDRQWLLAQLRPLLEDPAKQKIGHNLKYEYVVFKRYGITLRGMACDTMVASYVLNPSKYRHSLDNVSIDYLDHRMISFKDIAGTGKKAITFDYVPIDTAVEYACEDSDITAQLARLLEPKIQEQEAVQLFHRIEMPLVEVLATMEMNGVRIDVGFLGRLSAEFHGELSVLENKIFEIAGESFNINSPKQLGVVLFEKLGLPVLKKTKTGYSTNVETLTELAERHPLPREVLSYRSLAKLTSTYIDAMPNLVHPATGRIHTSYNQTVTATGRLSSSEPNLQNIPIRTEEGVRIREAFITEPGWKMLSADYSQVELRVLAHMCEDETLIDAFNRDEDIHARTAAEIWGGLPQEVDPRRRREAKAINFGIIYGMSSFGLGKELGISPQVAGEYIDSYFARYGRVKSFLEGIVEDARQKGYVATLLNRRRYLPDIKAKNGAVRKFAERTAVNAPIQGTAADLIKIAMINIAGRLEQENLQARMLMQVHDELVFEAPEAEIETLAALVRSEMEGVIEMKVPLRVDMKWGDNWREAH